MGPYSLDSLRHAPITSETMVNKVGTQEWVAAGTVPELHFLFVKKSPSNSLEEVQKKNPTSSSPNIHANKIYQIHYPEIPSHLTEAIIVTTLSTLCCCSPISVLLGIIAIVSANKVDRLVGMGYRKVALAESDKAQKMIYWAIGINFIWLAIYLIINMIFSGIGNIWQNL